MTNVLADDLDVLPFGWRLLQRIDDAQVVVGPGGVFLVHDGAADVERSTALSVWLSATCGFEVECEPVVVVHPTTPLPEAGEPSPAQVVPVEVLDRWLQHMPRRLDDAAVADIVGSFSS